ncbi:MAG: RNA-binding S4 domain-containing protein [Clostridiales bacterium]|nr:RNA-binding S4 domain-containing protein [Clostridiales bacterium]
MKIKIKAHIKEKQEKTVKIDTEFIRLDALLKLCDCVQSGGHAKICIQNGEVRVNGEICLQRGKKMHPGETAEYNNMICKIEKNGN